MGSRFFSGSLRCMVVCSFPFPEFSGVRVPNLYQLDVFVSCQLLKFDLKFDLKFYQLVVIFDSVLEFGCLGHSDMIPIIMCGCQRWATIIFAVSSNCCIGSTAPVTSFVLVVMNNAVTVVACCGCSD